MPRQKSKKTTPTKKERTPRKKKEIKKPASGAPVDKAIAVKTHTDKHYIFAVGRRKSSVARVRFYTEGPGEIIINRKPLNEYFPYFEFQNIVTAPLILTSKDKTGKYSIKVTGGGKRGQAEAVRLGISRVLLLRDATARPLLKAHGLLHRDSRIKERKKYGLKKARRAPQWQKR
jgi:small subunit ribosomal protein S9